MTNQFQILITARDRASSIIGGVGSALSKIPKPLAQIGSRLRDLDDATTFDRLNRSATSATTSLVGAARGLGTFSGGTMGLIGGAGTLAGAAALIASWGQVGVVTANAAAGIGVLPGRLRTLQGAATLAGLSADDMTGSLRGLATTLQDAQFGRNNTAAAMLNTLGIVTRRTRDGAVDAEAALGDLAEAISRQTNPQTQAKIAQIFGVEALLPMLRRGRAGWTAYIKDIERLAKVSEATQKDSEALGDSLGRLRAAAGGVGVTIEAQLNSRWGRLIDGVSEWTAKNKETAASITGIGVALAATATATTVHPLLGLMVGVAPAAALAYQHIDDIRGVLDDLERKWAASRFFRRETDDERKAREAEEAGQSWWRRLLPSITIKGGAAPSVGSAEAAPAASPSIVSSAPPPAAAGQERLPIGLRNNNPGNLRRWGDAPIVGGFARFKTPEAGLVAAARNLLSYQDKHGINTLAGIAGRWAPTGDGNDPAGYARSLSEQTGIAPNQPLNLRDRDTLGPLLSAIIRQENGRQPYSQQQIEQAVKVTIEMAGNPPPGMKVTAENAKGFGGPAPKIEYSMQSWATP
ncbi:hypothetical protein GAY28_13945 [Azospirillum brasilense]|nr:hypothetical protein [Azospirillum brasilense]